MCLHVSSTMTSPRDNSKLITYGSHWPEHKAKSCIKGFLNISIPLIMVDIVGHTNEMESTLQALGIILQVVIVAQPTLYNIKGPRNK